MAESLYRKYRPQIFEDVVGQEHIERTLKNAIEHDKVSHAYLFCGPRGTGKTTTARLLAKALLCQKGPTPDPDGTCEDCVMIANGEHPDVNELDAASRTGVENVREEIIGRVQFAPTRGRYKVYIIDEVHMLSQAAFNALLKTLEEPPSHVVFILCTTDPQKVPETIHSRCQRFDFRRISNEAMVSRLGAVCVAEGVEFEGEALDLIAHRSDGGMRNALTSLEQVIAFSEGAVTLESAERLLGSLDASDLGEIVGAIGRRDVAACFTWTAEYVETGADLAQFTRDLALHMRNLYVMTLAGADVALDVSASERRELEAELSLFAPDRLARLLGILGDLGNELKTSTNPRLSFEIALTRMVRPDSDLTLESLAERIEALESGYSAVAHVPAAAAMPAVQVQPAAQMAAAQVRSAAAQPAASYQPQAQMQQPTQAQPAEQRPVYEEMPAQQQAAQSRPSREDRFESRPAAQMRGGESSIQQEESRQVQARPMEERLVQQSQPQPQPQQQAPSAVQASGGAVSAQLAASLSNPASLQRVWQAALTMLKKEKAAYGVLFLNTKAVFDAAAGALSIEFPVENTFAFKAAQKPEVQDAVAAALVRACGESLSFSYTQGSKRVALSGDAGAAQGGASALRESAVQTAARSKRGEAETRTFEQPATQPQPQPRPQPQIKQQPQPEPRRRPQPQPQQAAPTYDDAVPYDDDDVVPYGDDAAMSFDIPPWEEPAAHQPERGQQPACDPQAQQPQVDRQRQVQQPSQPQAGGIQTQPAPSGSRMQTTSSEQPAPSAGSSAAPEDLQAILAAGFGDGVTFEEVRE